MFDWKSALVIFVGGGFGAVCRWIVGLLATSGWGVQCPYGTLTVNLIGCLVLGVVMALCSLHIIESISLRQFLVVGFLGGLTTFGTLSFETLNLLQSGDLFRGCVNIVANLFMGILLTYIGFSICSGTSKLFS